MPCQESVLPCLQALDGQRNWPGVVAGGGDSLVDDSFPEMGDRPGILILVAVSF